jgi:hypothetical protein
VASGNPGAFGAQPSPAYTVLDLGELTMPAIASGLPEERGANVRLWVSPATSNVGVSSSLISIGGMWLQPLDGPAGILPRGLVLPTIGLPNGSGMVAEGLLVDAINPRVNITSGDINTDIAVGEAAGFYRGRLPYVGASTVQLDIMGAARRTGTVLGQATGPLAMTSPNYISVSVRYRPRFTFMKGI